MEKCVILNFREIIQLMFRTLFEMRKHIFLYSTCVVKLICYIMSQDDHTRVFFIW